MYKKKTKEEIIEELNNSNECWGMPSYYGVYLDEFSKHQIIQIINKSYGDSDCFSGDRKLNLKK